MYQIAQDYLAWKGIIHAPAQKSYRRWLQLLFEILPKPPEEITEHDIGKYKSILDEKYSRATVRYALIVIKNFFKYCQIKGMATIDPWLVRIPAPISNSFVAATEDEVQKMLVAVDTERFIGRRDCAIISMLADTGVRVSELCAINLADIDYDQEWTVIKTGKNQQSRPIFWSPFTHEWLKVYIEDRIIHNHPALFISFDRAHGVNRLTTRSVERLFTITRRKAGIKAHITPHSMRHHRAQEVGQIEHIAEILGHKSIESSRNYLRFRNEKLQKIAVDTWDLTHDSLWRKFEIYEKTKTDYDQAMGDQKPYPRRYRPTVGQDWKVARSRYPHRETYDPRRFQIERILQQNPRKVGY